MCKKNQTQCCESANPDPGPTNHHFDADADPDRIHTPDNLEFFFTFIHRITAGAVPVYIVSSFS